MFYPPVDKNDTLVLRGFPYQNSDCLNTAFFTNDSLYNYNFIPNPNTPIKYIRVNLQVIQDENGNNNFVENNPDHLHYLNRMFNDTWSGSVNGIFKSLAPPLYQGIVGEYYVEDSRIQFSLENIYFHQDDGGLNDINGLGNHFIFGNYCENNFGINTETEINIFLLPTGYHPNDGSTSISGYGPMGSSNTEPPYIGKVLMYNIFYDYEQTAGGRPWIVNPLIGHELGHVFGFRHTFSGSYPEPPCNISEYNRFYPQLYCPESNLWCSPASDEHCSNNMMGYNANKSWLAPLQIGHLHRVLSSNPVRMRYLNSFPGNSDYNVIISTNTVWDMATVVQGDIIIQPEVTLEITCLLSMLKDTRIIVKPGGKLIVDGGVITNPLGDIWHGIYVEGDRDKPQTFEYQGALILKNGAIIENSKYGVLVRGVNDNWWNNGGIVQANDAIFRNNWRNVSFHSYPDSDAEFSHNNISYFRNCTFETDDNTLHATHTSNLSMWNVQLVRVENCSFIDNRSNVAFENARIGILTSSASFVVDKSSFDNMKYGIYSTSSRNRNFRVSYTDFSSYRGIYFSGMDNVFIYDNSFFVEPGYKYPKPCVETYGIYLEYAQNFLIENNTFNSTSSGLTTCGSIGLIARNTGSYANEIYRNDFSGFTIGIEGIDRNRGRLISQGLELLCNRLENNAYDFYVALDAGGRYPGIRAMQGFDHDLEKLAGNLFGNDSPILVSNFVNECEHIHYFHHDPASEPRVVPSVYSEDKISLWQSLDEYDYDNSCPRKIWLRPIEVITIEKEYARSQYEETSLQLKELIDAGDSDYLRTSIEESGPGVNIPLYRYLMEIAPFLSEEVLAKLAEKETGFNHAMIRNVLVKSPQAPKLAKVVEKLDNRNIPLPPPMRQEIDEGLDYFGEKELLEQEAAYYKRLHDLALNEIIMNIAHESEGWEDAPDIKEVLSETDDIRYQYLLAELYFEQDNFEQGMQVLNNMESEFEFSDDTEIAYYNDYVSFYSLLQEYNSEEYAGYSQLPEETLVELTTYLNSGNRIAGKALSLLILNNAIEYEEVILYPGTVVVPKTDSALIQPIEDGSLEPPLSKKQFSLYPNPGYDNITFSWCLETEEKGTGTIKIYNTAGILIQAISADESCGSEQLQLSAWKSGNYTAVFKWNNNIQKSINFIIAK